MGETVVPALAYRAVTKRYIRSHLGRTTVSRGVDSMDLQLRPGETLGLLGLNGSGKTTSMKLALGLLQPTEGSVAVFGHPSGSADSHRLMGYLPELPYFYPYLTPTETLNFFGRLSGVAEAELPERVRLALARVGLGKNAGRKMGEFSKGMLQRVGLAQAVLHEPKLVLLDEPVSGLDPLAIAEFRELFLGLRKEGRTLLLSSHSISEVERICDRAAILVEGRLTRVLEQKDWQGHSGRLEELFVETVRPSLEASR